MKKMLLITILLLGCFAIGLSTLWAGTGWTNLGDVQSVTGTNSAIAPNANDGEMMNQATTTTSGSNAGVNGTAVQRTGRNLHFAALIELPNETDTTQAQREWWGLTNTTLPNMVSSDTPAFSFAAFRFSSVATDTTFKCVVGNGTTTTVKDTGVTADANAHYFDLIFDDTTGNIQCAIDGTVKATFANTDAVPPSGTNLLQFAGIQTQTNATKNIREGWMLTTSDK